jgi:hypothetical protein
MPLQLETTFPRRKGRLLVPASVQSADVSAAHDQGPVHLSFDSRRKAALCQGVCPRLGTKQLETK